jgi:hypothetical protein
MTGMLLIFVVVFALALAAGCALLVLRMLPSLETTERPTFPRRPIHHHHHSSTKSAEEP